MLCAMHKRFGCKIYVKQTCEIRSCSPARAEHKFSLLFIVYNILKLFEHQSCRLLPKFYQPPGFQFHLSEVRAEELSVSGAHIEQGVVQGRLRGCNTQGYYPADQRFRFHFSAQPQLRSFNCLLDVTTSEIGHMPFCLEARQISQ